MSLLYDVLKYDVYDKGCYLFIYLLNIIHGGTSSE